MFAAYFSLFLDKVGGILSYFHTGIPPVGWLCKDRKKISTCCDKMLKSLKIIATHLLMSSSLLSLVVR